ncbi:MAG: hypothetical protein JO029_12210 [Candidatus Eremiobacteraeota bacterium]|nr:hypothetical protein [Candidatus Eremiobacteraeota bacterium]
MLQNVSLTPSRRTLEFGIYRDGDNNLDAIQSSVIDQAVDASAADSRIQFTVEDTTALHSQRLHTDEFTVGDGLIGHVTSEKAHAMSDEANLARFVARTLDNAEASGAKQTWIELVDHGGGDGGGLQTGDGSCMSMPDIAKAISDGVALHAKAHPEDAGRNVDGVVANQCLMATMGFADALSHAGVKWLAASPETMVAPGVTSDVAQAIASHEDDPVAMAKAVVGDVMRARDTDFGKLHAAAAFDVLDLDANKIASAESAIKAFNDLASASAKDGAARQALREDVRSIGGMARIPAGGALPWHADRSAIAVYDTIAGDGRLDATLRTDAAAARDRVSDLVLAHRESRDFGIFGHSDYSDAIGPTVHLPTSRGQIDPWAREGVSETRNAFYRTADQDRLARAIA